MSKICLNQAVIDLYRTGVSMNDAIKEVHKEEIAKQCAENSALSKLTPFNMVMQNAGISKYSTMGDLMNTAMYTSSPLESNEWLFPAFIETTVREALYADDIISYLCNTTIGIDGNIVKSATLDLMSKENKKGIQMARVAEGADLPIAKIKMGEQAISLWKHGRAIEMTYEAVRRMRIDLFQKQMRAIVADIAHQNLDCAVDVLVNGDGNNNAAAKIGTVKNLEALNAEALAGIMIDYWMANHYAADTITANKDVFKKLVGWNYNKELAPGASMQLTFTAPQLGGTQNVTLLCGDVPQIGGHKGILLSNRDMTLIRYEENGSNIQQNQQFARNQTNLMTVSENSGYAINTKGANQYIEITA